MTEIRVPTLGESVTEATVGTWLVKEGDHVSVDDPIVELETDKVSVQVPAPAAGVIGKISAKEGDTVELDGLLGEISEGEGAGADDKPAAADNGAAAEADEDEVTDDSAGGETVEVTAPASGESVTEADIGEWMFKVGDRVELDEPIVSLETDKAAMDVPAPASGTLTEIRAEEGATVTPGDVIAIITKGGSGASGKSGSSRSSAKSDDRGGRDEAAIENEEADASRSAAKLSPAARRIVEENDLDAGAISGTGKGGLVTKGDAIAAAEAGAEMRTGSTPPQKESRQEKPAPAKSKPPRKLGEREERVKMSRLRQTIARRLKESQDTAAMLTTFNDVDMSAVMGVRKEYKELFERKHGVKLGFMSFFVKACCHALREVPEVNAEIDGTDIIYKDHYDVGIAVGTEKGLVVPVLRDADTKSLAQIEKDINDYGRRGRDGELTLEEMQGGTFTITNGGVYGSLMSTPILNMPQSGILGMHRIEQRPVVVNGEIVPRPMMYLALSYDHRIVDGKGAVTFLVRVKENLEDPRRLMLDL